MDTCDSTQCNIARIFIRTFSDFRLFESTIKKISPFGILVLNLKEAACESPAVHSPLKCMNSVKDLSLLWCLIFRELFRFTTVAKKGMKHSEL